jgi:hypothetical protein
MSLETELRALDVEWPATPPFAVGSQRRLRRRWIAAAALAAAALAAVFAVPQSRSAALRLFHLGGATIRVVPTLPPAADRGLADGLGRVVPLAEARRAVPGLLVPPGKPPPAHLGPGGVVSFLVARPNGPILLSELPFGHGVFLKKLLSGESAVAGAQVGAERGFWLAGRSHVVVFPRRSPRLAGPVLLWERGGTTYRLEGPGLTQDDAIGVAVSLRRG